MSSILYISFDGLTDPLGASQIMPYLAGLAKRGYAFTIVSLEKPAAYHQHRKTVEATLQQHGIRWVPVMYSTNGGIRTGMQNNKQLKNAVDTILGKGKYALIHSRSYPASIIAMKAAAKFGLPFIFDMRGFWADERVDGKIWNLLKPHHALLYRYFKYYEKLLLKKSTHVISLTQAAKNYMVKTFGGYVREDKITVIPCCADLDYFVPGTEAVKHSQRRILGIEAAQPVLIYLGSVGTWYLLDDMIAFYREFEKTNPGAVFLVVTQQDHDLVHAAFKRHHVAPMHYRVISASRAEVPAYIQSADAAVYFIKPAFSKMASSPVKLAEYMGCGLTVFANAGIGDVDLHAAETSELILLKRLDEEHYRAAVKRYNTQPRNSDAARDFVLRHYALAEGVDRYEAVYKSILNPKN